jgi:hypothetical protein
VIRGIFIGNGDEWVRLLSADVQWQGAVDRRAAVKIDQKVSGNTYAYAA